MYQNLTVVGNVGRDAEMRYTPSGVPVLNFSVASSKSFNRAGSDEKEEKTTWFAVALFGNYAEALNGRILKGTRVLIQTDFIEARAYLSNDGDPRAELRITAQVIRLLSGSHDEKDKHDSESQTGSFSRTNEQESLPF
jgi:single-strand DNA-binding protein